MKRPIPSLQLAVGLSSLAGAVRVIGQIVAALVMLPLIVARGGVAALGAWVMMQAVVGYGGLTHLGMGTLLTKEVGGEGETTKGKHREYLLRAAQSCGILWALLLAFLTLVLGDWFLATLDAGLSKSTPRSTIWIVLLGVLLRLFSALYGAVVSGHQRHYIVQLSQLLQIAAFLLTFLLRPASQSVLYDLAVAFTFSYVGELVTVLIVVRRLDPSAARSVPQNSLRSIRRFVSEVRPYFLMDACLRWREPLLKVALYICCGPASVGVFELASRIPAAIRQAFVFGLTALVPAVASLDREPLRDRVVQLGSRALQYVLFTAVGALFLYGLHAERILELWLGTVDPKLVTLTRMLTFWWFATSLNVPAWWVGVGMGYVWANTVIAAAHLAVTALLVLVAGLWSVSDYALVGSWIAGGLGMQVLLYTMLERHTGAIKRIYLSVEVLRVCVAFIGLVLVTFAATTWMRTTTLGPNVVMALSVVLYVTLVVILVGRNLRGGLSADV